jgi:hypothetical protein
MQQMQLGCGMMPRRCRQVCSPGVSPFLRDVLTTEIDGIVAIDTKHGQNATMNTRRQLQRVQVLSVGLILNASLGTCAGLLAHKSDLKKLLVCERAERSMSAQSQQSVTRSTTLRGPTDTKTFAQPMGYTNLQVPVDTSNHASK